MNVDEFPTLVTAYIRLHDIYGGQSDEAIYAGVPRSWWQREPKRGRLDKQA